MVSCHMLLCTPPQIRSSHASLPISSPFLPFKKPLKEIDIPPRKFFSRRAKLSDTVATNSNPNLSLDVTEKTSAEDALLQKFFPCNTDDDNEDLDDPYSSDEFLMYEFKVRRCMRSRSHDWTECPFSHPGEKARRRDPRRYHYSGNICTDFRRGGCRRGDACEFAHGVFECWLHPARYCTLVCEDGKNCKRKVCFFVHTPRQLRVLPLQNQIQNHNSSSPPSSSAVSDFLSATSNNHYVLCHNSSISLNQLFPGVLSYKNALAELVYKLLCSHGSWQRAAVVVVLLLLILWRMKIYPGLIFLPAVKIKRK
ncbi:hypothetical protein NE237_031634 [Protea cynaroides]|uniref:C3H1-type domain-containing protein n=1 Tax=Protea cynaroides TaxID=273540 RepID=A0A9Q0L1J7_9MAGN|nr:hypothetical protein NE237_031634 [Protea cynaroides]